MTGAAVAGLADGNDLAGGARAAVSGGFADDLDDDIPF